jgi:beta-lactamase regulating signal transducer with metallopeptidase domain
MMQRALIEYIVNALWQIPLLAAAAWLLLRVVKPGPRTQHCVWLAVLGLAVLLPIDGMGRMSGPTTALQPIRAVTRESAASLDVPSGAPSMIERKRTPWFALSPRLLLRKHTVPLSETYAQWLVRFYLVAVSLAMLRVARAWHAARALVADSRETTRHRAALANYSLRFRVRAPQLRESAAISSPMIVGVTKPILLIPEGFERFTEEEIGAALCHELAHIKRRDYLVNAVCQLAAVPVAWHPVLLAVQERIRMTREMVCDAMAAEEMESELGYAKCLLALAQSMLGRRGKVAHPQFLGLFSHNTLEERVMELMETAKVDMRAKVARITAGAAVVIASFFVAATVHVTPTMAEARAGATAQVAQDAPAPQTRPAVPAPEPSATVPATKTDEAPVAPETPADTHRDNAAGDPTELSPAEQTRSVHELHEQIEDPEQPDAKARDMLNSSEFKKQMEDFQGQAANAKDLLNNPEFKKQMEGAQRQALSAKDMLNNPAFKKQMEDFQRQAANAKDLLNNPEFKKQMEDAQLQALSAKDMLNNPAFKKQMEDFQRQAANAKDLLNNPEFKKQMENAQRQTFSAKDMLNNPEFKKQMKEAQRQAFSAKDLLNNPEFKKQMEEAQRQALNAKDMLNNPEFKKQMEDVERQAAKARDMLNSPEFKNQMEDLQRRLKAGELPRSLEQLSPPDVFSPNP